MKTPAIVFAAILTLTNAAFTFFPQNSSADITPAPSERTELIRRAEVWFSPSWISEDFRFESTLDVFNAPITSPSETLLLNDHVTCQFVEKKKDGRSTGITPKFHCHALTRDASGQLTQVLTKKGEPLKLKVKYGENHREVYGEVLASRLLWSLGFAADRMYFVNRTECYGCPGSDPNRPQIFSPTAIERKMSGKEILRHSYVLRRAPGPRSGNRKVKVPVITEGWDFSELTQELSPEPRLRAEQSKHRNALMLLAAFMNHVDNKTQNQRLFCIDKLDQQKRCSGRVAMMIHDVGATFGGGLDLKSMMIVKADYRRWSIHQIWKNPARCKIGVDYWFTQEMSRGTVTEAGRQFLVKLLRGFSDGPDGRKRVEDLFRAARLDQHSDASIQAWRDLFMSKIEQLEFPMGRQHPNFKCPN